MTEAHADTFGGLLTEVRMELGLSQREFSKRYGIPLGTLRGWEQGRRGKANTASKLLIQLVEEHPGLLEQALRMIKR